LTTEERDSLHKEPPVGHDQSGHGHGAPLPVSGGSHDHDAHAVDAHAVDAHAADGRAGVGEVWPDLTRKEALTLFPLAVLTIVTGVYPKPIFDIVEPSFERILAMLQ
jgi:hypothetical protein